MRLRARSAIAIGTCLGILLSASATANIRHTSIPVVIAQPVNVTAVSLIQKYNKDLSMQQAQELFLCIERTVQEFQNDKFYQKGVAMQITPELLLALVLHESGANNRETSCKGAIGLTQVMPFHVDSLHEAGILDRKDARELRNTEKNIRSGVYILMQYARTARTVSSALARYNAGVKGERHGYGYADRVLRLYRQII